MTAVTTEPDATTRLPAAVPLAITSVGVVSAAGLGLDALGEALASGGRGHAVPVGEDADQYPQVGVRSVEGFRLRDHVGRKGTRNLDRLTGFGLVSAKFALEAAPQGGDPDRTGVVVTTSTGSTQSLVDLAGDTLLQERPYLVNPSRFPNTVLNCCAGQIAIWNGLRGANVTLAAGQCSGLNSFRHARMVLGLGRADRLVVGGVEELSAPLAWGWHASGTLAGGTAIGEGGAAFVVSTSEAARAGGAGIAAEVLGVEVGFHPASRGNRAGAVARHVERALARSGVSADEVTEVSPGSTGLVGLERAERRGIAMALGRVPEVRDVTRAVGQCYSAAGAMQVAGLLAAWRGQPSGRRRLALVTAVGHDGNVGALVLREGGGDA
ncbi:MULTISPECIES: beta-ketoacyl synthase N-terminal-like domain-containing protein [unclassified Nocardiopsis]|uniref:beta-ketoacyl synthase N-terminal-like domain-containing protein n=1 Tax=unclassified Nocardiopsis TaxID=2649073 RepID=UPI001916A79A|nr:MULTISPECIES: beta-ketoacyl synthase N-terminal-like domain-containing protein [unclassified Nocardiopsis]